MAACILQNSTGRGDLHFQKLLFGGDISVPTGTVTFLFTDIEGSTKLAQEYPDQWETLRARHNAILQSAMDTYAGYVFQIVGDAYCVAFRSASDALNAALHAQQKLQSESWSPAQIHVRMGIHTGPAQLNPDSDQIKYLGYGTLVLTQRSMSAGHGGQVLLSGAAQRMCRTLSRQIRSFWIWARDD